MRRKIRQAKEKSSNLTILLICIENVKEIVDLHKKQHTSTYRRNILRSCSKINDQTQMI